MGKSKQVKRLIKERIQNERGEYGRKRRKKLSYLKNTGELGAYYLRKQGIKIKGKIKGNIRGMKKVQVPSKGSNVPPASAIVEKRGLISKVKSFFKAKLKSFKLKP